MSDLQLVSAFDGIAGFPLAFATADVETVATIEIDQAAAGVAACHYPSAAHFADITEVTPDDILGTGFDPVRGVFSGGWPCTDLSLAGLRLGLGGARSGLVGEVFRLLTGLRPRWVVLENVPGLLSSVCPCPGGGVCSAYICPDGPHVVRGGSCGRWRTSGGLLTGRGRCMALHGGGMGTVLRRLGECGYGVAYRVLDAQHFGVPQRRRRVVIVGHLGDSAGPAEILLEPEGGIRDLAARGSARAGAARGVAGGVGVAGPIVNALTSNMAGGGGGADDNTAQGNHLVATTLTAREGKGPDSDVTTTLVTHALTAEGADVSEDGTGRGTPLVPVAYALRRDPGSGQGHNTNFVPVDLAQVTSAENRRNPQPAVAFGHKNSIGPAAAEDVANGVRASGGAGGGAVAFGHTNGIDEQASEAVTPTLRAGHGVGGGSVATPAAVRRLTPVECERLQGFPDGWTAKRAELVREDNRWTAAGKVAEQSDSARYRQLGNSIAGPVFAWVAAGIVMVDAADAKHDSVE